MSQFTESILEDAALGWLESLGYAVLHGPETAAEMPGAKRSDPNYRDVVVSDGVQARIGTLGTGRNGSSCGARSPGAKTPRRRWLSCECCWMVASTSAGSLTWCRTSLCSRTQSVA